MNHLQLKARQLFALCTLALAVLAACGGARLAAAPGATAHPLDVGLIDASAPDAAVAQAECPALPEPIEPAPERCAPDRYEPLPEGGFEGFEGKLRGKAILAHLWRSEGHVGLDVLPAEGGTMTHYLGEVADCTWLLNGPLGMVRVSGGATPGNFSWALRVNGSKSTNALALKHIARDGVLKIVTSRESRIVFGAVISDEERQWLDETAETRKAKRYRCDYGRDASVVFGARYAQAEEAMSARGGCRGGCGMQTILRGV